MREETATLIAVEEAKISGDGRDMRGDETFQNLGNGLKENSDAES